MRKYLALALCLVWTMSIVVAYDFNEKIEVNGRGSLTSETNSFYARDSVQGMGIQKYSRNLSEEYNYLNFDSNYNLIESSHKDLGYFRSFKVKTNQMKWIDYSNDVSPNSYSIFMNSNRWQHKIHVDGTSNLTSNSRISFEDQKMSTNYRIKGSGVLTEAVLDFDERPTPSYLAKTRISDSNFSLTSGMNDAELMGSTIDQLISWARNETPVPPSKNHTPVIDFKKGGATQTINQTPQNGPTGTEFTEHKTPSPFEGDNDQNETNETNETLEVKSAPNKDDPPMGGSNSAKVPSISRMPLHVRTLNLKSNADIVLNSFDGNPVPTAYIGTFAQFDHFSNDPEDLIEGYSIADEDGRRTVISNDCGSEGTICQEYIHISAPGYVAPAWIVPPVVNLDYFEKPPIL